MTMDMWVKNNSVSRIIGRKFAAMGVVAILLVISITVSGDHVANPTPDPKGGAEANYIGLGIGDYMIQCLPEKTPAINIYDVEGTVYDPLSDNSKYEEGDVLYSTGPILPPGGPIIIPPQDIGERVCLGGAYSSITTRGWGLEPPDLPEEWQVWAIDEVYEMVKQVSAGEIDIVPSGFAAFRIMAIQDKGFQKAACVSEETWTQICAGNTGRKTFTKWLTAFSFCGQGGVNSMNTTSWDGLGDERYDVTQYVVEKKVFMDGPIFYGYDCGWFASSMGPFIDLYNDFACWWDNRPGKEPGTGRCGIFDSVPRHHVCDSSSPWNDGCLWWFGGGRAECWAGDFGAKEPNGGDWQSRGGHESGIATIGKIGWSHEFDMDCSEPGWESNWRESTPSEAIVVNNFPIHTSISTSAPDGDGSPPNVQMWSNWIFCNAARVVTTSQCESSHVQGHGLLD